MKKISAILTIIVLTTTLGACGRPASEQSTAPTPATPSSVPAPQSPSETLVPTPSVSPRSSTSRQPSNTPGQVAAPVITSVPKANQTTVKIYKADSRCENLVVEEITVPAEQPVKAAIGRVIDQNNNIDFDLSQYQVNVNRDRQEAVIDLKLSPKSKRDFESLSSCEQLALFDSLQKTLTSNAQWNIKNVRFTEQGKEIVL